MRGTPTAERLAFTTPLELLRAPAAYEAAADLPMVRRLGGVTWLIAALFTAVLLPVWPPDHAIGRAGWVVAGVILGGQLVLAAYGLLSARLTTRALWINSCLVLVSLATLGWLSGGMDEYTKLMMLPLVYVAASQTVCRVALAFVIGVLALLPALVAQGFPSQLVVSDLVNIALWLCGAVLMLTWTAGVRWQRMALRASEDRAHHRALQDPVTRLGNRRKLLDDLEWITARREPAMLAIFDLNGFKTYNDVFGHPAGDLLLARLGEKLDQGVLRRWRGLSDGRGRIRRARALAHAGGGGPPGLRGPARVRAGL